MKTSPSTNNLRPNQSGFLLLEVLVTIIILVFGLLGLAGLQAKIQTAESESYQRTQALLLLEDMLNRLSANRNNPNAFITATPLGAGDGQPSSCAAFTGIPLDLCEWSQELKGAAEKQAGSGTYLGAMVDARGCIELIAGSNPPVYRVSVAWQGLSRLNAPSLTCGQNLYGAENYRRVVAGFVPIANLVN